MAEIEFFGAVDKTRDGKISSVMPGWFFDVHLEKLEESISRKKRQIDRGQIPHDNIFMIKNDIKREEDKIKTILASKPKLTGKIKDTVYQEYRSIEQQLIEAMPSHRENQMGFVNPRDEMMKDTTPGIKISSEMAASIGVTPVGGKISRKQASKFYKIAGKLLGENTNLEKIRREGQSESYRTIEDLTRKVLERIK